jgi:prevent-host-death family protein
MDRSDGSADDRSRHTRTMDASKVRGSFARVLDSVRREQKQVIIVRYGRPMAALVPLMHLAARDRDRPPRAPAARVTRRKRAT